MRPLLLLTTIAGLTLIGATCVAAESATRMTSDGKPPGPAAAAIEIWFTAGREISCSSRDGTEGPCGLDRVNAFRVFYDKAEGQAVVFATWSADTGNAVSLAVAQFGRVGGTWSLIRNLRPIYGEGPETLDFAGAAASFTMTAMMPGDGRCCLTGTQRYEANLQTGAIKEGPRLPGPDTKPVASPTKPAAKFEGETWLHNGSEMLVDEKYGEIRYDKPKPSLAGAVKPGDVLFRGTFHKNGAMEGTAYAFKIGCPPAAYPVKGTFPKTVTFSDGRMILKGPGPKRKLGSCEVDRLDQRSVHSTLVLDFPGDI